jgi:hypothetical protein
MHCRWWRCCWYLVVQQQQLLVIWVNMGNQRLIGLLFAILWRSSATKCWYLLCYLTLLSFATWHLIFYLCTNSCLEQLSELWAEKRRGWPRRLNNKVLKRSLWSTTHWFLVWDASLCFTRWKRDGVEQIIGVFLSYVCLSLEATVLLQNTHFINRI